MSKSHLSDQAMKFKLNDSDDARLNLLYGGPDEPAVECFAPGCHADLGSEWDECENAHCPMKGWRGWGTNWPHMVRSPYKELRTVVAQVAADLEQSSNDDASVQDAIEKLRRAL